MAKAEKVYEYVDVDDRTPVQKLSLGDQVRVLIKRLTFDPSQGLKSEDALTKEELRLRADLRDLLMTATEPIRRGSKRSVDILVSHKFEPIFDSVVFSPSIVEYYKVTVDRPIMKYDVSYFIKVRLEVRR